MVERVFVDLMNGKFNSFTWEVGVHLWLCLFMTGVGVMKASGMLKHDLSRIVGVLEALGGAVFLNPFVDNVSMYLVGSAFCLTALGMVISVPKKRKSPVCWIHAALTLVFLNTLKLPKLFAQMGNEKLMVSLTVGVFPLVLGIVLGNALQTQEKAKSS